MDKANVIPNKSTLGAAGSAIAPLGTPIEVRGKLALLGWPSLAVWGEVHGYSRNMPKYVVKTWGNATRWPHGGIARHLMANLRETLETGKRFEQMSSSQGQ